MMKVKTSLVAGALLLAGLSLKGDVLYWMVDAETAEKFPFAYASVASSAGGYLPYVDDDGETVVPEVYKFAAASVTDGGVYVDVAGLEEAMFQIELFSSAGRPVASGDMLSYVALMDLGVIVSPTAEREHQTPWMGGAFMAASSVPEPTSGLLLLMGLAGLALRRRRA